MPPAGSSTHANSDREATLLMIQWVIWKWLSPRIVMDSERMQGLAEDLAESFYAEGVRMPLDDDPLETSINLQSELLSISDEIGPVPMTLKTRRERMRVMAQKLFGRGWRKFSPAA